MTDKQKKWLLWISKIRLDAQKMMIRTHYYERYLAVLLFNPAIQDPPDFHNWSIQNYFDASLMSIRRLVKKQNGSISLSGLLEDLRDSPSDMTEEFYLRDYPKGTEDGEGIPDGDAWTFQLGKATWKRKWGGSEEDFTRIVDEDLAELLSMTKVVEDYIDNVVAHTSQSKGGLILQKDKVKLAIRMIERIAIKYVELLEGKNFTSLTPTFQYSPEDVFLKPWIDGKKD